VLNFKNFDVDMLLN